MRHFDTDMADNFALFGSPSQEGAVEAHHHFCRFEQVHVVAVEGAPVVARAASSRAHVPHLALKGKTA